LLNIVNKKAKRLYVAEFDRQMTLLERIFVKEIRPVLNRQYLASAAFVQQGVLDIAPAVNAITPRLINRLYKHYKRVANTFAKKAYKIIENSKSIDVPEIKGPKDEFFRAMNTWMVTEAGDKITKINTATRNNINSVIQKGLNEGISHRDIAKNIRKNGLITNRSRSLTIARTETHTVAVKAVDESVRSTRIEMEREWVSAKDLRTRTFGKGSQFEHFLSYPNGPDGERVGQDAYFQRTGQPMQFPGDPKGSAGNVIRCRCVIIYHSVKRTEELKPYVPEKDPEENIKYFESTIAGNDFETAAVFNPKGIMVLNKKGKESSVDFTQEEMKKMKGNTLTHNHPKGSSFSLGDLRISTFSGMKSIRAIAPKGNALYKLDIKDPDKYFKNVKKQAEITDSWQRANEKVFQTTLIKIHNKEMTVQEANLIHHHEVMEMFSKGYKSDFVYEKVTIE
jgi:hypothetical protein